MTPLQVAKRELIGCTVTCAVGDERSGTFQGYPGVYQIVGLTAKTVIVAPYASNGELNTLRKKSIKLATGESTPDGYGVRVRMAPAAFEWVRIHTREVRGDEK